MDNEGILARLNRGGTGVDDFEVRMLKVRSAGKDGLDEKDDLVDVGNDAGSAGSSVNVAISMSDKGYVRDDEDDLEDKDDLADVGEEVNDAGSSAISMSDKGRVVRLTGTGSSGNASTDDLEEVVDVGDDEDDDDEDDDDEDDLEEDDLDVRDLVDVGVKVDFVGAW